MHCTTFKDYRIRWEYTYYLLSLLSIVYQQIEKKFFLLPFMILFSIFIWHLRKRKPITQIFFFPFKYKYHRYSYSQGSGFYMGLFISGEFSANIWLPKNFWNQGNQESISNYQKNNKSNLFILKRWERYHYYAEITFIIHR